MSPSPTFGEMKKSAPSKVSLDLPPDDSSKSISNGKMSPSTPRRVSSKWHPSLIKLNKERPPLPNTRSISAERVRATRALYSSWHREMVAKSKERISSPKGTVTMKSKASPLSPPAFGRPKSFLLGRRAVSESRFTIEDRVISPTPAKHDSNYSKKLQKRNNKIDRSNSVSFKNPEENGNSNRGKRVFSVSPARRMTSPHSECSQRYGSPSSESGRPPVSRHTVSSKIKTKSYQNNDETSLVNQKQVSRSKSADFGNVGKAKRHSCCTPTFDRETPRTLPRRNSRSKAGLRSSCCAENKRLRQSESFDTTHSNETGYSSMLDLSPSPSPENNFYSRMTDQSRENSMKINERKSYNNYGITSSTPVVRRTLTTGDYAERRAKWEILSTNNESKIYKSCSPPRSLTPLRSTSLVREASNSIKQITSEVTNERPRRSLSLDAMKSSKFACPNKYRQYIIELRLAAPNNAKVLNLQRLFTSLDRAHNLERSISSVDLSLVERKASYLLGFEEWKKLKSNERNALEYRLLINELNSAQTKKDFLFNVAPEKKWKGDAYLRGKEESVSEIRDKLSSVVSIHGRNATGQKNNSQNTSVTYRKSKRETAIKDKNKFSHPRPTSCISGSRHSLTREDSGLRSAGMWTSLSMGQVDALKDQLNDIYGSMQDVQTWRERKKLSRSRSQKERGEVDRDCFDSVDIAETGRSLADQMSKLTKRSVSTDHHRQHRSVSPQKSARDSESNRVEAERRKLSKQLSIELKEKVGEQRANLSFQTGSRSSNSLGKRTPSLSPDGSSRYSPRTCYSIDISDSSQPSSLTSQMDDQFVLVLHKPTRSRSLPPDFNDDGESSDSDMSVRTVIHKDVAGKVKFFEKRARKTSRSSERQSSQNSKLSLLASSEPCDTKFSSTTGIKQTQMSYLSKDNLARYNSSSSGIYQPVNALLRDCNKNTSSPSRREVAKNDFETKYSRSYLKHVKTGDVYRLRERYESSEKISAKDRQRTNSLPNLTDTLARVTPLNKTVIRAQENGDVRYIKSRYENQRKSRSPTRWVPNRDEYVPKSKITSTLERLGVKSDVFIEPETIHRISQRDSIEKQVLKRVHTGHVETTVGKLESNIHLNSDVSILGQMYTSSPSLNELAKMSPLVPPRPYSPLSNAPQKPQRLYLPSKKGPLQTSTPVVSPIRSEKSISKLAMRVVTPPEMNRCFAGNNFPNYNAENHKPKSRYIPPDSEGAVSWTRSLERPKRLVKPIKTVDQQGTNINSEAMSRYSSYSSYSQQMSMPSSRLSYSSTFSTNPSRSSIASQCYFPSHMNCQQYTEPSSLPYISNTLNNNSVSYQGSFPEPDNYYHYRTRQPRYDCRSLSPPRQQDPFYPSYQRRINHLSPPSRLPMQDSSLAYNQSYQYRNRNWISQPQSLPSSAVPQPQRRPLSPAHIPQKYRLKSSRAQPPRPPTRIIGPQANVTLPRTQPKQLPASRDHNFNKAVTWKGAV